jgi:hypothetical protein
MVDPELQMEALGNQIPKYSMCITENKVRWFYQVFTQVYDPKA